LSARVKFYLVDGVSHPANAGKNCKTPINQKAVVNTGYPHNYPHKLKSILEAPEHLIGTDSKPGNPMML